MVDMPEDQLKRSTVHEREHDWPDKMLLVAQVGRKSHTLEITKDAFFGTGSYGAPLNGDQLINMIHRIRRMKA